MVYVHITLSSSASLLGMLFFFFFFNDTATTEIYTLSLHDALPISIPANRSSPASRASLSAACQFSIARSLCPGDLKRSEEHTSELQSRQYLVCRLLLEKKKHTVTIATDTDKLTRA